MAEEVGIYVQNVITERTTKEGLFLGGDLQKKGYSKSYRLKRQKSKREAKFVDLHWRGNLMRNINHKVLASRSRVVTKFFINPSQAKKGAYLNARRKFMGFSKQESTRIDTLITKEFYRSMDLVNKSTLTSLKFAR